jgi:hypothetical protein
MKTKTLIAIALACMASIAHAQTKAQKVFRCGPDGRIYSQTPCKDGATVEVADPRSTEQQRAAAQANQREQAQNEKAARERHANEVAAAKQGAAHIPYTAAIKAAAPASAASAPGKGKKKAKAKPAAQG